MTPNFDVHSFPGRHTTIIQVFGEVDLCTAPRLAEEITRARSAAEDVLVDLEHVEFIDCAGLRVLVDFARAAEKSELGFSVTPGSRQVQKLFELTEVGRWLRVIQTASGLEGALRE